MGETLQLLLAAGYFRARIKGLSPFDKIVGGMTWAIATSNEGVDVDILFEGFLGIVGCLNLIAVCLTHVFVQM